MNRHKIILNPQSAKGATRRRIPEITKSLDELGLKYTLSLTERPWHAAELAREAVVDGYDVVVAVGGDGTVNEVVNGVLQCQEENLGDIMLGVLPVGRGNDFCFASGIPVNLQDACQLLARASVRPVDAGRISGEQNAHIRYFGNGVGIGFDAVVSRLANQARLKGFLSYFVAVLQTMYVYYQAPEMQIHLSNEVIRQRSLMVSVMNGRRAGGGFLMAPHGNSSDGLFDICIAKNVSKAGILSLIPRFMNGTQGSHPAITYKQDPRVTVRAVDGSLPVHADGEVVSAGVQEITVEILPRRLQVITGANQPPANSVS